MAFDKFRYGDGDSQKQFDQVAYQIREAFEKFGTKCMYIPTDHSDESLADGDYETLNFNNGVEIYLKIEGWSDFGMENMWGKFGREVNDIVSLYGTIAQFEEIGIVPKIGDLIYVESTNQKLFEVTNSTYETIKNKYPYGAPMTYEINAKTHNVDMINTYDTLIPDVDTNNDQVTKTNDRYDHEINDKITDNNIVDDSEDNPLYDD